MASTPNCSVCGAPPTDKSHISRQNRFKQFQEYTKLRFRIEDKHKKGIKLFIDSIDWLNFTILFSVILMSFYGALTTKLHFKTFLLSLFWYFLTGVSITAGYHRCFAHKAYKSRYILRLFYLIFGAGAGQGSIKWWSTGHRAHHRYTDTEKDPYNAQRGFFYAHIGWLLLKQDSRRIGKVCTDDLKNDKLIQFQHKNYLTIFIIVAFIIPACVAHYFWSDFRGGFFYAGWFRLMIVQHGTFCVNSLAHFWGNDTFDDILSPRDSIFTALVTLGEGYHNFHHEFPNDYRNAIRWYQYDPTKWFIRLCVALNLAYDLKIFSENEIKKGFLFMRQKHIHEKQKMLNWGKELTSLPIISIDDVKREIKLNPDLYLIVINKIVYDVSQFLDEHPGGSRYFELYNGCDATEQFDGKVYNHSSAARNLLAQFRYARLSVE